MFDGKIPLKQPSMNSHQVGKSTVEPNHTISWGKNQPMAFLEISWEKTHEEPI